MRSRTSRDGPSSCATGKSGSRNAALPTANASMGLRLASLTCCGSVVPSSWAAHEPPVHPSPTDQLQADANNARQSSIAHCLFVYWAAHCTAPRCPSVVAATLTDPISAPAVSTAVIVWLLVGIRAQGDHHGSRLLSVVRGVVRTGRWARLSAGREVTLLSSHAGRSAAPDGWQNTQQATLESGHRYGEPTRRTSPDHDTEPIWVGGKRMRIRSIPSYGLMVSVIVSTARSAGTTCSPEKPTTLPAL